jgi:hypothetical protein
MENPVEFYIKIKIWSFARNIEHLENYQIIMSSARTRNSNTSSSGKKAVSNSLTKSKKASGKEQAGLRTLVQQRLLNDIFQRCAGE